jgi:hypothetical protein
VIDFANDDLIDWIDTLALESGFEVKQGADSVEWVIDVEEEKKDLGKYFGKFGHPKIRANIFYRVFLAE